MYSTIPHWINGSATEGDSSARGDVFNPATGAVARTVPLASANDVNAGVAAAKAAFAGWGTTSIAKRTAVMFAFRELFNARKDELAAIITAEHGKVLSDPLLCETAEEHRQTPHRDPGVHRARPLQRPRRILEHQDPPHDPHRVRLQITRRPHRPRDAQPRRA